MPGAFRYAATAAFMLIVVASGFLHGEYTNRWKPKPPIDRYADRIDAIPKSFDDWTSEEIAVSDDLRSHGIQKYIWRKYLSRRSTETYSVLVVCGAPGPIASHTPDVCYRGSGYIAVGEAKRADITAMDEASKTSKNYPLNLLKFRPPASRADATELEIRWAWMPPGKGLMAPENPRYEFASEPALFKVYIVCERPSVAAPPTTPSPSVTSVITPPSANAYDSTKFLQNFLPRLEAVLKDPPGFN